MIRTENQTDAGAPGCFYGGQPTLPSDIDWPVFHCPDPQIDVPMHFVCQIDFAQVPRLPGFPTFPSTGTIFVFIECVIAPEYFDVDPHPLMTGGGAKIIYVKEDVSACPPRKGPDLPVLDEDMSISMSNMEMKDYYGVTSTTGLHRWPMTFVVGETFSPETFLHGKNTHPNPSRYFGNMSFCKRLDAVEQENDGKFLDRAVEPISNFKCPHYLFGASSLQTFMSRDNVDLDRMPEHQYMTEEHVNLIEIRGFDPSIGYVIYDQYPISAWIKKADLADGNFDDVQFWGY